VGPNIENADEPVEPTAEELADGRRRLAVTGGIVLVQALALLGFALWLLVSLFVDDAQDTRNAVIEIVSFGLLGALLVLVARATWRARRWSRGAVVTTQLFSLLGVAVPLVRGELWGKVWYAYWVGVPLGVVSVAAGVLMMTPNVVAALYTDD
jgi:hypothetical protein